LLYVHFFRRVPLHERNRRCRAVGRLRSFLTCSLIPLFSVVKGRALSPAVFFPRSPVTLNIRRLIHPILLFLKVCLNSVVRPGERTMNARPCGHPTPLLRAHPHMCNSSPLSFPAGPYLEESGFKQELSPRHFGVPRDPIYTLADPVSKPFLVINRPRRTPGINPFLLPDVPAI